MEKVCVNHPESPSVGSCKACEKPVCLMCIVEVAGVSFCSEACGSAYQEVKDWLERPAADEEWNPLADAKPKTETPPVTVPADPSGPEEPTAPTTPARKTSPSGAEMRAALSTAFGEDISKISDPIPQVPAPAPASPSSGSNTSLYIAIAATVIIVVGLVVLFSSSNDAPPPVAVNTPAKVEPPKPEPPKPEPVKPLPPPPPPPKPEPAKVEPPKPEPVKPPPPKPEPAKVEPPKPVVPPPPPPPKPEPAKVEPPKPVVPPPPPPKPEPAKVEPPKPEPAKVEPPKPVVPPPPPPKPEPAKVEPPPATHLAFLRDPWGKEKAGAWYRIKTTAGGQESYRDIGLRESGAGYRVVVSQTNAGGKTEPEQFTWTEPEEPAAMGSVSGDAQGVKFAADVVKAKSARPSQYVIKDGPHAGATFPADAVLTKLDRQDVKVKDRSFSCSVMETETKEPRRTVKTWFSPQVPVGTVKSETEGLSTAIIDFGDDWSKRPPFPEAPVIAKVEPPKPVVPPPPPPPPKPEPIKPEPIKPEPAKVEPPKPEPAKVEPPKPVVPPPPPPPPPPPKPEPVKPEPAKVEPAKAEPAKVEPAKPVDRVKKSLADAAGLIREATPLYQEVAAAMEGTIRDRVVIQDLISKAERVQLKLGDAKVLYSSVKSDAPDPAVLDRRLSQIDDLIASAQECVKQLKKQIQ